jgi:opacity protein-like surface antigen
MPVNAEFSIQGLAGLHLDLGSNIALKAGYRYYRLFESEINGHFLGGGLVINF